MAVYGENLEITIGAGVTLVGAVLLGLLYSSGGSSAASGYEVVARFNRADGLAVGSDVRLSGMPVGKVVAQSLDEHYRATTTLRLAWEVQLPTDTAAVIQTDGLMGSKFVALQPGGNEQIVKPGATLQYTQDAVVVQDLLEMIINQAKAKRAKDQAQQAVAPAVR